MISICTVNKTRVINWTFKTNIESGYYRSVTWRYINRFVHREAGDYTVYMYTFYLIDPLAKRHKAYVAGKYSANESIKEVVEWVIDQHLIHNR